MSSDKNDCEDCGVCRLFEMDVISVPCDPPCYEEEVEQELTEQSGNDTTTVHHS
ncbi:MAG: hypothetical protein V7L23_23705 [Nostoc sp.]|uniref:hypothetical protein n=1 Tax=Nostoc sp. TaxID=1180 RepID=UPI002FF10C4A